MSSAPATGTLERGGFRIPPFHGEKEEYDRWKTQFLAVLNQKDLAEIVAHLRDKEEMPTDDNDCEDEHTNVDADRLKLKQQNTRAYALLVVSMATDTDQEKLTFDTVSATERLDGYANGYFKKAWLDLKELLRPETIVTLGKLKQNTKAVK